MCNALCFKDLNSQLIEQSLLEQIRIVYLGLDFPIFLKGSAVVILRIGKSMTTVNEIIITLYQIVSLLSIVNKLLNSNFFASRIHFTYYRNWILGGIH